MYNMFPQEEQFIGIFRGEIIDNNDPKQLRRCKVKVYPMMAKCIDLPWAVCKDSRFVDIPEVGAKVYVEFENGDIMMPIYSGYICGPDNQTVPVEGKVGYPATKIFKANGITVKIDELGTVDIDVPLGQNVNLGGGLQKLVDERVIALYNVHTHPYVDTPIGAAVTSPPLPGIVATAVTTIKTKAG